MQTKRTLIVLPLIAIATTVFLTATTTLAAPPNVQIRSTQGQIVGTATVTDKTYLFGEQSFESLSFKINLMGLPPGDHRVSIREHARCDAPDFTTVGGQLVPPNSSTKPQQMRFGDLGNITVNADGKANASLGANTMAVPIHHGHVSTFLDFILRNGGASL